MINTLLFIHAFIALLLIVVILLQRTGSDGITQLSSNNMGVVSGKAAATFLTKMTIWLGVVFFLNCILIGNLLSRPANSLNSKLEQVIQSSKSTSTTTKEDPSENSSIPVAK